MKNNEISSQIQRLEALMKKAAKSTDDVELLAHWARYFCVIVAGIIENGVKEIYSEYVTRTSTARVAGYARTRLSTIQNPNSEKLVQITRSFDVPWATALEKFIDDNGRKDAVDSIMNLRHQIAHGRNAGVSYVRVVEYLQRVVEVLEFVETQVRPN
jgi:hypothetical protein